jgi:hypothetical protein
LGVDARVFRGDFRGLIMPVAMPCAKLFRASIPRKAQAETGLPGSIGSWPGYARLVSGEVMAKKEELFVQAAQSLSIRLEAESAVHRCFTAFQIDVGDASADVLEFGWSSIRRRFLPQRCTRFELHRSGSLTLPTGPIVSAFSYGAAGPG